MRRVTCIGAASLSASCSGGSRLSTCCGTHAHHMGSRGSRVEGSPHMGSMGVEGATTWAEGGETVSSKAGQVMAHGLLAGDGACVGPVVVHGLLVVRMRMCCWAGDANGRARCHRQHGARDLVRDRQLLERLRGDVADDHPTDVDVAHVVRLKVCADVHGAWTRESQTQQARVMICWASSLMAVSSEDLLAK